jgi:SAM-dependent methyltransferase
VNLEYSFPHYLLAKQSVDDRSLNRSVLEALKAELPPEPIRIMDAGAGVGTMLARLLRWKMVTRAEYVAVDERAENADYALEWIQNWARNNGLRTEPEGATGLRIWSEAVDVQLTFERGDAIGFARANPASYDLLIAHALLDLLPMPESLSALLGILRPGGLGWLTLNFDGLTSLQPPVDPALDAHIERLYHLSMDTRPTGGGSQMGRQLFGFIGQCGADILAAGPSDWVVYPHGGVYSADERYLLDFILYFFQEALSGNPQLDARQFEAWLAARHGQVERGELIYIAHQLDFLVRTPAP